MKYLLPLALMLALSGCDQPQVVSHPAAGTPTPRPAMSSSGTLQTPEMGFTPAQLSMPGATPKK